jgi:hypothetical protein
MVRKNRCMTSWIISLALVLALNDAARAEMLLDTVLYVVSLSRAHDNETETVAVRQTDETIEANFVSKTVPLNILTSITHLDHCRFRVDRRMPMFPDTYTVDFAKSEFRDARITRVPNVLGTHKSVITIPSTRYCYIGGNSYLNAGVKPGACVDRFEVDYGRSPNDMFAALDRLHSLCAAPSS